MPRKPDTSWYQKVAELMVRHGKHFLAATTELGIDFTSEEGNRILKSGYFQKILWTERNKFYQELANNPERNKTEAIGRAVLCIENLMEKGEWEKALEGILKLSKIEGWVGSESNVNVFAGLNAAQIAELRERLAKKQQLPPSAGEA